MQDFNQPSLKVNNNLKYLSIINRILSKMTIITLYTASTEANTNMFYDIKEGNKNISLIKILHINTYLLIIVF